MTIASRDNVKISLFVCFECDSLSEEVEERRERRGSGSGSIFRGNVRLAASLNLARREHRDLHWPLAAGAT